MGNIISSPFRNVFAMFLFIGLYSCNTYNFSDPLPSGKQNIYEFPADWQGKWQYDTDHQAIIYKDHIEIISKDYNDVVKCIAAFQSNTNINTNKVKYNLTEKRCLCLHKFCFS